MWVCQNYSFPVLLLNIWGFGLLTPPNTSDDFLQYFHENLNLNFTSFLSFQILGLAGGYVSQVAHSSQLIWAVEWRDRELAGCSYLFSKLS